MKIYSLNPALSLRNVIPEGIYNNSESFVQFLKAYYEWMHTTEFTVEPISGTLLKGEALLGQTSKTSATISQVKEANTSYVVFVTGTRPFEKFETLVGQTSGAEVRLLKIKDNVLRQSDQLGNYRDLNKTVDQFESYLKEELYYAIPSSYDGNTRELAKRLRDFYLSKGQEQAYRYFMKTLYDQDIEITYPGDEILRVSDGVFLQETIIRANIIGGAGSNDIFNFLFKTIRGRTSNAIANVIDVKKVFIGTYYVAEMRLSLVSGVFEAGEIIYDIADTSPTPLETTLYGIISGYEIDYVGSGYSSGDALTITGDGVEAAAQIGDASIAKIDAINLLVPGYGYRVGTLAAVDNTGTGGSGLIVRVSEIANSYPVTIGANTYTVGEVSRVSVANTGSEYFKAPTLTLNDSVIAAGGLLTDKYITIANSGNNYVTGDWLGIFGTPGSGANAEIASVGLGIQDRTNYIRNSSNTANVVIGTPGTLANTWYTTIYTTGGTLATSVVGSGVESGLSYVDVRISGTSGTSSRVQWYFNSSTSANAQHGEIWAGSLYTKLVSGSFANTGSYGIRIDENTTSGAYVTGGDSSVAVFPTTASLSSQRFSYVRTLSGGSTVGGVTLSNIIYFANNSSVDFTIRLAAPQLEKNYFVTDYIPTTNNAVTIAGYGEPTRINHIRNSRALDSAAGTPGTAPTNWVISSGTTLSSQLVGSGVEDGINYIDVRLFGTNSSGSIQYPAIRFESITQIATVANSVWTTSAYLRRVGGTTANVSGAIMVMAGYTANGVSTNQYATNAISSLESSSILTNRRIVISSNTAFSNTQTAFVAPWFQFQVASSNTIDVTIRIGAPQTEFGNTVTSYIPTSNGAARRPSNEPTNDYDIYLETGDKILSESKDFIKYNTSNTSIAEWMGMGRISRVAMTNFGSGYSVNALPVIVINSPTGSSGNLVVTNIQGRGASIAVDVANNTQSIGGIRKIVPTNFGIAYTSANVTTTGYGDENANITPIITGSAITVGDYVGDRGKLNYKKIQDSYYYQEYSYVIKSGIEISKYKNVLKKLLHPSGLEVFGEIQIINNLNLSLAVTSQLIRSLVLIAGESLEVSKITDFIFSELYPVYGDVPISVLQNNLIFQYQYYTFQSPFGIPVYLQVERNIKTPGTVSVYSSNSNVFGVGTTFTSNFSNGDLFATQDRNAFKNVIVDSEKYSTSNWTKVRASISENSIQAPFDDFYADKLIEDTTSSNSHYFQSLPVTILANKTWTASIYAKAGERNLFQLIWRESTGTHGFRAEFDLNNFIAYNRPTYGSGSLLSQSIINVGNGWYRCIVTGTIDSSSTQGALGVFMESTLGNLSYTGDGNSGMYFWGAQVENSATVTNYGGAHPNRSNKFTIDNIISDTQMTVKIAPPENVINTDIYALTL